MIDYQVVRSARRKTLSLQVKQGKVVVRAPHHVDPHFIQALVQQKSAWLKAKIVEQAQCQQLVFSFTDGDTLLLFGQAVRLQVIFAKKADTYLSAHSEQTPQLTLVMTERQQIKSHDPQALRCAVKKQLEGYFKAQAQALIIARVEHFSALTQLHAKAINIRQYRARWGSCNSRGELSFNYLMMMLPVEVIDYIVVHELCHLAFLNHSADFWQLVAEHFPRYLQAKQWLKDNQSQLQWQLPHDLLKK